MHLPRYDPSRTYRWNYDHAPAPVEVEVPDCPGEWSFCGCRVGSPLGVPAGPLLNGDWVLYYASLGFDVLTYKTVRSSARECYPLPNLQPVATDQLSGGHPTLPTTPKMQGSWAVSYGMPSATPDVWRADVERTRDTLDRSKLLSVSVVGTIEDGWSLEDLAADYARCAKWAVESGADVVETNFSCPNVSTCDGQLYQQPEDAAVVAETVRQAVGDVPYLAKIGHVTSPDDADELVEALRPFVTGLAMTNSVAAVVEHSDGTTMFDGQPRGICGDATRHASVTQTRLFRNRGAARDAALELVGVGGASSADHVRDYLDAGASAVHVATAAMVDPLVAVRIRADLAANVTPSPT